MKTIEKHDNDYLIEQADRAISELVYDKIHLIKAYNYYSGIRDKMQFNHLEQNYGLGNPTSITFTPLVRKHIDALVGEFLSIPIVPKISCKDKGTLSNIFRDKQLEIAKVVISLIKDKLNNSIYSSLIGENKPIDDYELKSQLDEIYDSIDENFISNYEIAAQNIITYLMQSKDIDFKDKLKILILDLLISGESYYKVVKTSGETNIDIKILNPLNVFVDRNLKSPYLKKSYRAVNREWLSKSEILALYEEYLTEEDLSELDSSSMDYSGNNYMLVNAKNARTGALLSEGIMTGIDAVPLYNEVPNLNLKLYPVYEVEWIDTEKEDGKSKQFRYKCIRIGQDIYITLGKDESAVRSIDSPKECTLEINGFYHSSRTGKPYSLVLETADLQDKYDMLLFFRDNAFANSGSTGSWLDVAHLPDFLGNSTPEKLIKWIAYAKGGLKLYDTAQDGEMLNTSFNSFDENIKAQTIQAFDLALLRIEETASSITGVFRERLGGIEARDAVANVTMGMQQSYIITKQYYQLMELLTREMLIDSLNLCKKVYKKGITGLLILGENRKQLFTALPEHFSTTDYDIHVLDSVEIIKERESIKQLAIELSKNAQIDPELLIIVNSSKSLTELNSKVLKSIKRKKDENNQLQKLNEAYTQAQQQLKQIQSELQKASQQVEKLNEEKLGLDKQKLKQDYDLGILKITTDKDYKGEMTEIEKRRVELEALQLLDKNRNNDEIKNT